jgi:bifunctional DNA-binding transcriptional regulator/antitoxin component of YhaV-PrlF toxin-antitoxin module
MDSVVTSKGHVRIQKVSRKHSGLKPGDRIKFFLHPDGSVVLLPKLPAASLRGIVKPWRRPLTIAAMNEAVTAGAAEGTSGRKRR